MVESACIVDCCECDTFYKSPKRCALCSDNEYFIAKKSRARNNLRTQKKSNRMGAKFEEANHIANNKLLKAVSELTPNSGAGYIKGDEQLSGIVNIMEELKTAVVAKYSRGALTFTLNKEWLEKLDREAKAAHKEFWYLKFKFLESDDNTYVAVDQDIIMAMAATMIHDRKEYNLSESKIEAYKAKYRALEAENVYLKAKIEAIEAYEKYLKQLNILCVD